MPASAPVQPATPASPLVRCVGDRAPLELAERDLLPRTEVQAWRRHRDMLVLSTLVVGLSFVLCVVDGEFVAVRGWPQYPLPHTCLSRTLFHTHCPACGLTRSFILLAEGRLAESYARHHMGLVLAIAVLLQFPYRGLSLWKPDREWLPAPWRAAFSRLLIGLLVGNWLLQMLVPGW